VCQKRTSLTISGACVILLHYGSGPDGSPPDLDKVNKGFMLPGKMDRQRHGDCSRITDIHLSLLGPTEIFHNEEAVLLSRTCFCWCN
jgi:hypothetical protein